MPNFAVLDSEVNWVNSAMSIGVVVANENFEILSKKYFIFVPDCLIGGLYYNNMDSIHGDIAIEGHRKSKLKDLISFFRENDVKKIFAYDALTEFNLFPELRGFMWFDIFQFAAYKQYNEFLPKDAEYFSNGRLKSGFNVGNILSYIFGESHDEAHNALQDALDELSIMRFLGISPTFYSSLQLNLKGYI